MAGMSGTPAGHWVGAQGCGCSSRMGSGGVPEEGVYLGGTWSSRHAHGFAACEVRCSCAKPSLFGQGPRVREVRQKASDVPGAGSSPGDPGVFAGNPRVLLAAELGGHGALLGTRGSLGEWAALGQSPSGEVGLVLTSSCAGAWEVAWLSFGIESWALVLLPKG